MTAIPVLWRYLNVRTHHVTASAVMGIALSSAACDPATDTERMEPEALIEEDEGEVEPEEPILRNEEEESGDVTPANVEPRFESERDPIATQPGCSYTAVTWNISTGASGLQEFGTTCDTEFPATTYDHIMAGGCRITSNYGKVTMVKNHVYFASGTDDGWWCGFNADGTTASSTTAEVRLLCCQDI